MAELGLKPISSDPKSRALFTRLCLSYTEYKSKRRMVYISIHILKRKYKFCVSSGNNFGRSHSMDGSTAEWMFPWRSRRGPVPQITKTRGSESSAVNMCWLWHEFKSQWESESLIRAGGQGHCSWDKIYPNETFWGVLHAIYCIVHVFWLGQSYKLCYFLCCDVDRWIPHIQEKKEKRERERKKERKRRKKRKENDVRSLVLSGRRRLALF